MSRRNSYISLQGLNFRVLSPGTALDETTSPQEDASRTGAGKEPGARKLMPFKYGKRLEIEQLVHITELQSFLRTCNDATDADSNLAQGLVEVQEDGNSKLLSLAEYIAHAT
jgi:hypothetical protein